MVLAKLLFLILLLITSSHQCKHAANQPLPPHPGTSAIGPRPINCHPVSLPELLTLPQPYKRTCIFRIKWKFSGDLLWTVTPCTSFIGAETQEGDPSSIEGPLHPLSQSFSPSYAFSSAGYPATITSQLLGCETREDQTKRLFRHYTMGSYGSLTSHSDYDIDDKVAVLQKREHEGFGFVLRGAKAETPMEEFTPKRAFPVIQYLESVDVEGVAWRAGIRTGDFLIEVNSVNVVKVGHKQEVVLIRQGGNRLVMKVVSVTRKLEEDEAQRRAPPPPKRAPSTTLTLCSKSMTADLEELEKLDEILAAAAEPALRPDITDADWRAPHRWSARSTGRGHRADSPYANLGAFSASLFAPSKPQRHKRPLMKQLQVEDTLEHGALAVGSPGLVGGRFAREPSGDLDYGAGDGLGLALGAQAQFWALALARSGDLRNSVAPQCSCLGAPLRAAPPSADLPSLQLSRSIEERLLGASHTTSRDLLPFPVSALKPLVSGLSLGPSGSTFIHLLTRKPLDPSSPLVLTLAAREWVLASQAPSHSSTPMHSPDADHSGPLFVHVQTWDSERGTLASPAFSPQTPARIPVPA
ncbi:SH3 and multiple ankyrin repeat domains protein 3 [Sciurus carolinensis]|uniref:SH3 and multiple ankyrin repeat domains protein 3 n=1 Tax=Sciurus carolinensis TaxID=30640 RepID=A0AA41MRV7_SCICA|nr:SH3 and multiple ankyrin repeat domains protein 3 [Sciurus carolinensis]